MPRARHVALLLASLLATHAGCESQPSRLDPVVGPVVASGMAVSAGDPWSQHAAATTPAADATPGGLGFDLQGTLKKIAEAIDKPGPYEAPDKSAGFDPAKRHWGVLELGGEVVEREAFSWRGGGGTELRRLVDRLRAFARDPLLAGVVLRVTGIAISLPDVGELRAAIADVRAANKSVICHTEDASNATYLVLAACERIGIAPVGQVAITGPAAMPVHVKPLLDKLGVQADFLHVGAYKGAAEPLTRDAPSPEMTETIGAILDRRYATMVEAIARDRKLDAGVVRGLIDTALFSSEQAVQAKLVDEVVAFEAFRDAAVGGAWTELELTEKASKDQLRAMLSVMRFLGAMPPERPAGDHVAVVYALGDIVDGDGEGVLGARQQIASRTLVAALRAMTADDRVKAVVLRIDSGGGSAQASELIWRAVRDMRAKKPVIVSMSDVAASGGYYIAAGATKIFAQPDTLTGSIGVVGGKIAPGAALAKLGVNTFPVGRGKRATIMASLAPWSADERAVIQQSMEAVYRTFVGRVAEGRGKTAAQVEPLAQGRVWTGEKALALGLVDALGGMDAALAEARKLANIDAAADLEVYPPAPTLRDLIQGFGGGVSSGPLGAALAELAAIDPQLAATAQRLVGLVLSFRSAQIQTLAVFPELR